jgi:hypothetical protein
VLCFFFVLAHLLVWAVLDVQTWRGSGPISWNGPT